MYSSHLIAIEWLLNLVSVLPGGLINHFLVLPVTQELLTFPLSRAIDQKNEVSSGLGQASRFIA